MRRNIVMVTVIGALILTIIAYHMFRTDQVMGRNQDQELYVLNSVQKKWLEEKGILKIGFTDDSVPFLNLDDAGNPQGLLHDYMGRIEEGYGMQLSYVPVLVKELDSMLKSGAIDTALTLQNMSPDQNRRYTMPIIHMKGILLLKKVPDNPAVDSVYPGDGAENLGSDSADPGDGQNLEILLIEGSLAGLVLQKQYPKAKLIFCDSMAEMMKRMNLGEGNAMAGNEAALITHLGREAFDRNWERISAVLYERNECLAVDRENEILFEILNNAVYRTDNARVIAELQAKWTGISSPLYVENKLEDLGIIILIIFTAVLCVFFIFYQSNKSLYEELRQRMELLIESQHEMQTTFDGVTYYLAELARDGTVISINKAFAQYLSMKRHKAAGLPFESLLQTDENEKRKLQAMIFETFRDEGEKDDEIIIGKKIYELHTFLIKNNKEQIQKILLMMMDVTEVRNTERQMLQNSKMIAVGQLAAGVAHEIRNPLGLIRNYCYVLKDIDYGDYITRDDAIAVIEKSVEKSGRIIENLLNFSRLSTNGKEKVELKAHIGAFLDLQRGFLTQKKTDLWYEYSGESTVVINVEAIEILLVNLITNAADAIVESGEITVTCTADRQYLQLRVTDNGAGIPPELMDDIFNPFFTTKKKSEGSGLGLYIVYNEVQKMGGEIKAESEPGKGTAFSVRIPIDQEGALQ